MVLCNVETIQNPDVYKRHNNKETPQCWQRNSFINQEEISDESAKIGLTVSATAEFCINIYLISYRLFQFNRKHAQKCVCVLSGRITHVVAHGAYFVFTSVYAEDVQK